MPAAVVYFAPQDHVKVFAVLAALVAFVSMGVPPVAGALSDRLRRRGIPRRAFILVGAAIDVVCLIMMAEVRSLGLFAVFLLLATFGANVAFAAYQALLPDVVPKQFWGTVSGVRGVAMVIGVVVGIGVAAGTYPQSTFIGIAVAVALGSLTLFAVSEHDAGNEEEDHAHISDWHDFIVVFIARLFLAFGLSLLMTFILYFFRDVLKVGDPKVGTGLVAAAALIGSIASAVYLGWLSDRVPRKLVVAACGIPMTLAAAGFALVPEERWMFAFSVLFGIGFGGVLSTGWALAIDSVPKLRDVARDLGIWGIAQNFPAVIAPLFGGWLLAEYGTTIAGYRLLFFAAAGSFAIGSLSVLAVGRRPLLPWWGIPLRLIIGSCVWTFTHICEPHSHVGALTAAARIGARDLQSPERARFDAVYSARIPDRELSFAIVGGHRQAAFRAGLHGSALSVALARAAKPQYEWLLPVNRAVADRERAAVALDRALGLEHRAPARSPAA